jgi:hypothetical protein
VLGQLVHQTQRRRDVAIGSDQFFGNHGPSSFVSDN